MSDRDQDRDEKLTPNEFAPGEEEFDEEPEEGFEAEEESEEPGEESAEEEADREAGEPAHRRFGFTMGGRGVESHHRPSGSVRESHERVHVDDRASAVYALIAAVALLGILAFALIGNFVPQAVAPSLPPLVVPTAQPTSSTGASSSASLAPSASPTPAPSAAPSAT